MVGTFRLVPALAAFAAPAAAYCVPLPVGASEAVERQRGEVRDAVARPCAGEPDEETIVVCGQPIEAATGGSGGSFYVPPARFAAPAQGPWFEIRRGPLSISCCSVEGGLGNGAGLSLRIRF
ncbi:hypothetical protein [Allosphingosinicella sp.]|jgi:hypothetical protein|uniref:hypothetical protein n=1 Tax=Allosphingosinicella sp. TaxID=2823234 RepID=UPI002EECF965